jgi:hypothetical protein
MIQVVEKQERVDLSRSDKSDQVTWVQCFICRAPKYECYSLVRYHIILTKCYTVYSALTRPFIQKSKTLDHFCQSLYNAVLLPLLGWYMTDCMLPSSRLPIVSKNGAVVFAGLVDTHAHVGKEMQLHICAPLVALLLVVLSGSLLQTLLGLVGIAEKLADGRHGEVDALCNNHPLLDLS